MGTILVTPHMTHTEEMSTIDSVTLHNVEVQSNGIIRNSQGYLIGRLVDSVDYKGEYVKGVSETDKSLLSTQREEILAKVEGTFKEECVCNGRGVIWKDQEASERGELPDFPCPSCVSNRKVLSDLKQSLKGEGK